MSNFIIVCEFNEGESAYLVDFNSDDELEAMLFETRKEASSAIAQLFEPYSLVEVKERQLMPENFIYISRVRFLK